MGDLKRKGTASPQQAIHGEQGFMPYYMALLSAAAYHGTAHQAPMVFQVMVPRSCRGLACAGLRVDFIARADMTSTTVLERNTLASVLRVASPAATAVEIVGYADRCGYLDNVATVLAELTESVKTKALVAAASRAPVAWVQRLGYLLSLVKHELIADALVSVLDGRGLFIVPLAPWLDMTGVPLDPRWRVAINTEVEPDL